MGIELEKFRKKSQVRLASVLKTSNDYVSMIITNNDQTLWFNENFNAPIKINSLSVRKIKSLIIEIETIQGIDEHKFKVLALNEYGKLLTWSYMKNELNDNWTERLIIPNYVNLIHKTVIQVASSYHHTLALTSDGEVFAWGESSFGQLGTKKNLYQPMKVTKKIESRRTVAVACCQFSSFALTDNGDVFAWGRNKNGELGIGNNRNQKFPTKIKTLAGIKIRRLACGWGHVLAVADDGSMFAWGLNCNGQLGTEDKENKNKPVKIGPPGVKFIEVAAFNSYNDFSLAFSNTDPRPSKDDRCWVWGQCKIEIDSKIAEDVLVPKLVESTSIHDAIADYSLYQSSLKTMVIRQK